MNCKVHNDVRWSNIGKYRNSQGRVVVFDLHDIKDFNAEIQDQWVEAAMHKLY